MSFQTVAAEGQTMYQELLRCEWDPKEETWRDIRQETSGCTKTAQVQVGRYEWAHLCNECSRTPKLKCFNKKPLLYSKELRSTLEVRKNVIIRKGATDGSR